MALKGDPKHWTPDTRQGLVYGALGALGAEYRPHTGTDCRDCKRAARSLVDYLGSEPLVFRSGGAPMPHGKARYQRLSNFVREVHAYTDLDPSERPPEPSEPTPAPVPAAPKVEADDWSTRAATEMLRWIQRDLRPLAHRKGPDGQQLDEIGLRPAENAAKMLRAGITPEAIKHALTMSYPAEARRALGVTDYDVTAFAPKDFGPVTVPSEAAKHDGQHKATPYATALAQAGVPIALVGPKGTGKTHLAKALAKGIAQGRFGMVSMTAGTSPSAFNGRPKIGGDGGIVDSEFEKIYSGGGVYLFDEMDAGEPNLLLMVNAALANGSFANSAKGEQIPRSPDFVPVCAMNTMGTGADRNYGAREKLDAATLDRWNAGRVRVELDESLETHIFWKTVSA